MRSFGEYYIDQELLALEQHTPGSVKKVQPVRAPLIIAELIKQNLPGVEVESGTSDRQTVYVYTEDREIVFDYKRDSDPPVYTISFNWRPGHYPVVDDRSEKEDPAEDMHVMKTMQAGSLRLAKELYEFFKDLSAYGIGITFTPVESKGEFNADRLDTRRGQMYDTVLRRAGYVETRPGYQEPPVYFPIPFAQELKLIGRAV